MTQTRAPRLLPAYARALIRWRGSGRASDRSPLPCAQTLLPDLRADRERVSEYAKVCGFAASSYLPPTYPHVLAFPAAMDLMTRADFPLPLLGLVHVGNRISVRRPIEVTEPVTLLVRSADLRPHPAGLAFDMLTRVTDQSGEFVWESTSTYLHRQWGSERGRSKRPAAAGSPSRSGESIASHWHVPANIGRRYAAVSGDRNPIHLHPLTARLFGFRTAIAHGMWTKARVLAALEPGLPPAYTVEVAFRAPVCLPSMVQLSTVPHAGGADLDFALASPEPDATALDATALDDTDGARSRTCLEGTITLPA